MAISLTKGQRINLSKDGGGGLTKVRVGLGWDQVSEKKGGFFKKLVSTAAEIDCDASVLMLDSNDKLAGNEAIVYYGRLKSPDGSVVHQGDNLTGAGEGDDEVVVVDLPKVPDTYQKLVFVVNIYQAKARNQHFGMIENAFIRVVDDTSNKELCKYQLTENHANETALIVGELYRGDGGWKFGAIGQGTTDDSLQQVARRY